MKYKQSVGTNSILFDRDNSLTPAEWKVLLYLKNRVTNHGYYDYDNKTIAEELGCTLCTVQRSIRQLEHLRYIELIYRDVESLDSGVLRMLKGVNRSG